MPARKRPTPEDTEVARRVLLDGLARDVDIFELVSELAPVTRHGERARMGRSASGGAGMTGGACGVVVAGVRVGMTEWERPARLKFAA
jgi:hypothetical protein